MKSKVKYHDIFAVILLILIYVPLIVYFLLGQQEDFFVNISQNYGYGKIVLFLNPFSAVIFWFWMFYDWGNRTFSENKYKFIWFVMFFLTFTFGSTFYYFIVCKFKKGLK